MSVSASSVSRLLRSKSPFNAELNRKEIIVTSRDVSPHWAGKRNGTRNHPVIYCATIELRKAVYYWLRNNSGFTVEASGIRWVVVK